MSLRDHPATPGGTRRYLLLPCGTSFFLIANPKFTDIQAAVEALFSDDIMTHFYTQQGFAGRPLEHLRQAFDDVLDNLASRDKRALNILEIGAGGKC